MKKQTIFKLAIIFSMALIIISLIKALHLNYYLSLDGFKHYHNYLLTIKNAHPYSFVALFISFYIVLIACCIPGTIILDVISGFLFGSILGSILVIFSYSLGSIANFIVVRYVLKELIYSKFIKFKHFIKGVNEYKLILNLIGLRLIPIMPFWILNILVAILDVRMRTFAISTIIGIIPTSVIYVIIGNELKTHLEDCSLSLTHLINLKLGLPLLLLGILMILPVAINRKPSLKNP